MSVRPCPARPGHGQSEWPSVMLIRFRMLYSGRVALTTISQLWTYQRRR